MTSVAFQDSQLENVSVTFDKSLLQRSTPSAGIYVFDTPYSINITKYRVDAVIIPGTQFHVDDTNNQIVFTTSQEAPAKRYTATLENGLYEDETKLFLAVDAALTAASDAADGTALTYVVTPGAGTNVTLGNMKIAQNSGTFAINGLESTASHLLGLGDSKDDVASVGVNYTAPDLVQLRGPDALYVMSPTLTSNKSYAGKKNGAIAVMPLNEPDSVSTLVAENAAFVDLESSQSLRQFEVLLLGSNGLPIQLQDQPPIIKMTFAVSRRPIF
tara:strand:+ start:372 stop:1187 length:816 start_codon:yes stop_codon:yes gene_type:complete